MGINEWTIDYQMGKKEEKGKTYRGKRSEDV
jgi:hypothetical protein